MKKSIVSVFVATTLIMTGCEKKEMTETAVQELVRPALIEKISASSLSALNFNGVVESSESADLAFKVSGKLAQMKVQEGALVKKGQVLARLENDEFMNAVDSAKVEFDKASADYQRGLKIADSSGALSKSALEQLKTSYNLSKNKLNNAKINLANTSLIAPFDGLIAKKEVNNFTNVQANQPIYTLHDPASLEVVINVPSKLFFKRNSSRQAVGYIENQTNISVPLSFKHYSSSADIVSQTYEVVLSIDDLKGQNILPGMAVKVVPLDADGQANHIMIPIDAVLPTNTGEQFVWTVDADNRVKKQVVTVGNIYGDKIAVTSGLSVGDLVVTAGVHALSVDAKVRPME